MTQINGEEPNFPFTGQNWLVTVASTSIAVNVAEHLKAGNDMATGRFVAYYRVSTAKQGVFGLGLEAQREAVMSYLNGGRWKLVDEVTEVESGKRNDRPALAHALSLPFCTLRRLECGRGPAHPGKGSL